MVSALRSFLSGLIDYAGLFPPAGLDLEPTLQNFRDYAAGDHAWMLGRLIVPVGRLGALADLAEGGAPVPLSLLPRRAESLKGLRQALAEDLETALEQHARTPVLRPEIVETRLPPDADSAVLVRVLLGAAERFETAGLRLFWEVPRGAGYAARFRAAAEALEAHNAGRPPDQRAGLKLRCGGVTPDLYPDPAELADAISVALEAGVPFKATAGLHYPVRHTNEAVGAEEFGFLGVFGAAVLGHGLGLDRTRIEAILRERDAGRFTFSDEGFAWADLSVPAAAVAEARAGAGISYGSCSFLEPIEDLQGLGLLPEAPTPVA